MVTNSLLECRRRSTTLYSECSLCRYEDRQLFLLSHLPVGSSVVISSASQKYQSWNIPYEYKQNSSFHYLCGIDQPNLLLVLQKLQRNEVRRCLFMHPKPESRFPSSLTPSDKIGYLSPRLYPEDAKQFFGMNEVYKLDEIASVLPTILKDSTHVFAYTSCDAKINSAVAQALGSQSVQSVLPELDRIRWIKSLNEQKQLRFSSSICSTSFNELSSTPRPSVSPSSRVVIGIENRLSTIFEYNVKIRGAQGVSFPTMVAGGANSQYVEYAFNDSIVNPGEVKEGRVSELQNVVIDCGVSMNGYQSDMTRVLFAGDAKNGKKAHRDVFLGLNEVYEKCLQLLRTQESW